MLETQREKKEGVTRRVDRNDRLFLNSGEERGRKSRRVDRNDRLFLRSKKETKREIEG